jgi:3',5'-cyclic AMP phosphodiesterase CpdA
MKILILHLSDLHIKDRNGINTFQIKKIVDVVVSMGQFDRAILIVSGDIAYSGTKDQYKYAKNLLGGIIRNIMKTTQFRGLIDIMCVPGNHDINHGG